MDGSITRRGQPCWYRVDGVGNIAINDAFMVEAAIYKILARRFRSRPMYVDILELFHETTLQTELGQTLGMRASLKLYSADLLRIVMCIFSLSWVIFWFNC